MGKDHPKPREWTLFVNPYCEMLVEGPNIFNDPPQSVYNKVKVVEYQALADAQKRISSLEEELRKPREWCEVCGHINSHHDTIKP